MAFQGNSRTLDIPSLLEFILQHRLTGVLVIVSPDRERSFIFRDGDLTYAIVNDPGLLLGELLVRELELDASVIAKVVPDLDETQFLGEELVRRGYARAADINEVMGRQVRRALREVLRWERWGFHFQELDDPENLPSLQLCTRSLVFDLIRELDEWESIQDVVPLDRVVKRKPGSVRSSRPDDWAEELPTPGKLLTEIDGERTARRMLEESPYPIRALATGLAHLLETEAVELDKAEAPPMADGEALHLSPVIPNFPARILAIIEPGNASADTLQDLILADPVLTARSLYAAGVRHIEKSTEPLSMRNVLGRIGVQGLKSILIGEAVRTLYLSPSGFTWFRQWESAYTASLACREIADAVGYPDPELARVAALTQDIGSLVLAAQVGEDYRDLYEKLLMDGTQDQLEIEQEMFGTDHCRLGAQLADNWGFPSSLKTIIREHHSPLEYRRNKLLTMVRLANVIAGSKSPREPLTRGDRKLATRLGLSNTSLDSIRTAICRCCDHLHTMGVTEGQSAAVV